MLTSRIYHWARETPDQVALLYNGYSINYAAFARYISRARGFFASRGVLGPGVAVLLTPNLLDFWTLSLALRSLGFDTVIAWAPANIGGLGLPSIDLVATTDLDNETELYALCASRGWPLLKVSLRDEPDLPLDDGPRPTRQGGHILMTSGTTGHPKLVLMDPVFEAEFFRIRREQAGVTANSLVNVLNFTPSTGVGYKSPASTWDVGGTVLIHQAPSPQQSLLHPRMTHVTLTPLFVNMIAAEPVNMFANAPHPRVQIGGGTISQASVDAIKARLGPHIYAVISSTETATFAATRLDTPEDRRWHQPIPGRGLQLVDAFDQATPPGEIGHIRVSASGGPAGYLNDEEATLAFFKDGYFYPGDLAIMRADGRIALQGRVTDVLNIAGDKIAPAPLEEALEAALGVTTACLITLPNADAVEEIHAVIESAFAIDEGRLRAALPVDFAHFGHFHYHVVKDLPRDARGKLVRAEVRSWLATHRQRPTRC